MNECNRFLQSILDDDSTLPVQNRILLMNELFINSVDTSRTNAVLLWKGFGGEMTGLYKRGYIKPETLSKIILNYLVVADESMLKSFLNKAPRTITFHIQHGDAEDLLVKGSAIEDKKLRNSYIDYVTRTFKPGPIVFTRQNIKDLNEYNPDIWKRVQAFKIKGWPIRVHNLP